MSSWKTRKPESGSVRHDAGYARHSHDGWDGPGNDGEDDGFDAGYGLRTERPQERVERLTRTSTAAGNFGRASHASETAQELEEVASELDRLMNSRQRARRKPEENRRRPAQDAVEHSERSARARREAAPGRIGAVLEALERLDRHVETLSSPVRPHEAADDEEDFGSSVYGSHFEDEDYEHEAPALASARAPARRPQPQRAPAPKKGRGVPGYDFDELAAGAELDDEDDFAARTPRRAPAQPRRRGSPLERLIEEDFEVQDTRSRPAPRSAAAKQAAREGEEQSRHLYQDLARRIDALRRPQEEALDVVRREIGSLREAIGNMPAAQRDDSDRREMRRLAEMVEGLRAGGVNDRLAKELRSEISSLKTLIGQTNVDGTLKSLEMGYAHVVQRLDELTRSAVDPRVVRNLSARLVEIEDGLASLPRAEHLMVLEGRVGDISDRVESLLRSHAWPDIEPLRQELRDMRKLVEQVDFTGLIGSVDDRIRFVASRLDELEILAREQRGLDDRLSAMEERMPDAEALDRLNGRLEEIFGMLSRENGRAGRDDVRFGQVDHRLDEIMDRLSGIEQGGTAQPVYDRAFAGLENRLDSIHSQIARIEERASQPVKLPSFGEGSVFEAQMLAQLERQISDLSARLSAPRDSVTAEDMAALRSEIAGIRRSVEQPAPSVAALEARISELADAVSRGGDSFDDRRLDQITGKISALADQLQATEGRLSSVAGIEKALSRIESNLRDTREEVIKVAEKAARRAVIEKAPAMDEYDGAIGALRDDLRRLMDAAQGSETRTRNTFDGVQSILTGITDRLDSLERSTLGRGGASRPAGESSSVRRAPLPGLPLSAAAAGEQERPRDRTRDRKADFIAAARRAAHAASAEVQQQAKLEKGEGQDAASDSRASWFRRALRRDTAKTAAKDDARKPEKAVAEGGNRAKIEPMVGKPQKAPADVGQTAGDLDLADFAADIRNEAAAGSGSSLFGTGRKRAILLAAAAVVLAIGTLQVFRLSAGGGDTASAPGAQDEGKQLAEASDGTGTQPVLELTEQDIAGALDAATAQPGSTAGQTQMAEAPARNVTPPSSGAMPLEQVPAAQVPPAVSAQPSAQAPEMAPDLAFAPPAISGKFGDTPFVTGPQQPSASLAAADPQSGAGTGALPPETAGPMALRSAAAAGNAAAEFQIGVHYTEGKGVTPDLAEAARWYERAAAKGLAPAQYRLASLYEKGRGVPRDITKARDLYLKAAEAGNAKAMHNLAVIYAEGAEAQPDMAAAAKWFKSAAEHGVADSLYNLGILYARGIGVEKDLVESYKWFAIAARGGDAEAARKRDDVANMLDAKGLAAARLAVDTFKLKDLNPAANTVLLDPAWDEAAAMPVNASADGEVNEILQAQALLQKLGFDPGVADGSMGPKTRSAIEAFQRSANLPVTGNVDAGLIRALLGRSI
ncbi:peptidoglycan-binding protein [Pannonibacter indicus]|uniref:Putative peptidoglycan binding domain/Sel1 repeat n=1 Tax=Pannonibacter indicus TaxID=466044 RepID=A0A0K6HWD7_9HYPH|nr:peptidoglycan-binding protein [Pannonibacter indicus]CUA95200.1 Putative peptidoglycan binding domain/Sel1 repeat [Pannonibacter indicus]